MTTFDDDSSNPDHVPGLKLRNGTYIIDTSFNGKSFKKSTRTSDLNLARQILEEHRERAAIAAEICTLPWDRPRGLHFRKRQKRIAQGWPQPAMGNDPFARRQQEELYRSKEWVQRIRGMVDLVQGGLSTPEAAEAHGLSLKTAFKWMLKNRFSWIIEMVDAGKPAAASTRAMEDDSAR